MKTLYHPASKQQSPRSIRYRFTKLFSSLSLMLLVGAGTAYAQLNVSIAQSGTQANSCTRTLTAQVTNGSGSFDYNWSISAPGIPFPGPDDEITIHVGLDQTTDFTVFVHDRSNGASGSATVTVHRVLLGNFEIFLPNVFTPNGDGYNETWSVTDDNKGHGTINAYYYSLTVRTLNNTILYQASSTISTGHLGLSGGDISWNGRVNGNGNLVPVGTYQYALTLENCSQNDTYYGYIDVLY